MKHRKIVNYTTKDWLKGMGVWFCLTGLGMYAFHSCFTNKDYVSSFICVVGIVGWAIVYFILQKDIDKRNPLD